MEFSECSPRDAFRVRWFPEVLPHLRSIYSFRNNFPFEHFQHLNLLEHRHPPFLLSWEISLEERSWNLTELSVLPSPDQ